MTLPNFVIHFCMCLQSHYFLFVGGSCLGWANFGKKKAKSVVSLRGPKPLHRPQTQKHDVGGPCQLIDDYNKRLLPTSGNIVGHRESCWSVCKASSCLKPKETSERQELSWLRTKWDGLGRGHPKIEEGLQRDNNAQRPWGKRDCAKAEGETRLHKEETRRKKDRRGGDEIARGGDKVSGEQALCVACNVAGFFFKKAFKMRKLCPDFLEPFQIWTLPPNFECKLRGHWSPLTQVWNYQHIPPFTKIIGMCVLYHSGPKKLNFNSNMFSKIASLPHFLHSFVVTQKPAFLGILWKLAIPLPRIQVISLKGQGEEWIFFQWMSLTITWTCEKYHFLGLEIIAIDKK